jgi:type IV pilus assembly protein PilP
MRKKIKRRIKRRNSGAPVLTLGLILCLLISLPACGGNSKPPKKAASEKTAKKAEKKAVPKEVAKANMSEPEVTAYHYDPMGKKDPFLPLIKESGKLTVKMLGQGPLTPLQKYSLNELRLVAVLLAGEQSKAMVEDAKGDGYILSKGTLIGNNYGEVVDIKKNEVLIAEKEVDSLSGEIVHKNVSLILHKPEEEEL